MNALPREPDVIIVGAGAAGIAAGRVLRAAHIPSVILEARDRVGGRAWTSVIRGHVLDLGCEWLHSADRNVLAGLAKSQAIPLDKARPPWQRRHAQADFDEAAQADFDGVRDAFFARLEAAAAEAARTGGDGPCSDLLEPDGGWNALLGAISTYYNGAPLDRVSIVDFDRYVDTEVNWRVEGGYGALIAGPADGLPIRLGCRVSRIDDSARRICVETNLGLITAAQVIVTVPTGLLASDDICFGSSLDAHREAAAGLPLGLADKVFFELDDAKGFAPDTRLLGCVHKVDGGSYTLHPRGQPLVEGYFGGDYARRLETGGLAAFTDAARTEIAAALGHDIGRKLRPLVATAWAEDPHAGGSYSHALPGHADARAKLRTPHEERIFFAGEATSPHFFSTAHGAWEEGERAARRVKGLYRAKEASDRGPTHLKERDGH